jgi:serine/threonine protein kinase
MIDILENIHCYNIVHRDLKPQNFMIDSQNNIYLIDFGMATTFISADTGKHIIDESTREIVLGNPRYMSYNLYEGCEPVRRDDLISIGYMYLYFMCGNLPWDNIPDMDVDYIETHSVLHIHHYKNRFYKDKKQWTSLYSILLLYDDPIMDYMRYCYRLGFDVSPNYDGLKQLFV